MPRLADAASLRDTAVALAVTLAIQIFTSLAATAAAVLAPVIGRDVGVAPRLVGVFVGLVYAGSMLASLSAGHFIQRYGPIRTSQVAVMICAAGLGAVAMTTAQWVALLLLAALIIGFGYGPITPASSDVLARTAPPSRMALTFSIKQTGVPAGTAIAGALLPILADRFGWRVAFAGVVVGGVIITLAAQSTRTTLDSDRPLHTAPFSLKALLAPLRTLVRHAALVELSVAAFAYAAVQVCLTSFLVVYLTETLGFGLVGAGLALTAANVGGIVGRIVWGAVADQWMPPRRVLAMLGLIAACCGYVAAIFDETWPRAVLLAVCAVFGATAIGWNGVQLSEVARQAPPGQAGPITGATGFIAFGGVVIGPPLFAALSAATGSYRIPFAVFATASLAFGLLLLLRRGPRQ